MFTIKLAGENAIIIYFGDQISSELIEKIRFYTQLITDELSEVIIDFVPSYTSLMVSYKLGLVNHGDFCKQIEKLLNKPFESGTLSSNWIEIPVYYGLDVGLDLEDLLNDKELSLEQFIEIHSTKTYLVYAIGFSPAFAFLGEVDERIRRPRLADPRIQIAAGSVGIADNQTAVYPIDSSGGWNIIGRTPIDFSLDNPDNLTRFTAGDHVRFLPIDKQQYLNLGGIL
ncbi:MAG: 5-oxoprolinase subunit PxpB [Methylophagaceae bacterium]